jgi:predicted DNA-binding transcriptional regulator AlpA
MIDLMEKNPYISLSELVKTTGHSRPNIIRHYMTLKRRMLGQHEKRSNEI